MLTELVKASVAVISPKLWPPEFSRSMPLISFGESAFSTVSGSNSPESSAAAAVTTFIVDPGG